MVMQMLRAKQTAITAELRNFGVTWMAGLVTFEQLMFVGVFQSLWTRQSVENSLYVADFSQNIF